MNNKIVGKTINLSLANPDDAEFILSLRSNPQYNKHLSKTSNSIVEQRQWLINYKEREKKQLEFYFIIKRNDDESRIGTVRLYDFQSDISSFCWGSWILNDSKTKSAALESALLVYKFAFETLGFKQSHFDVRCENTKVIDFHIKLGAIEVNRDELDAFFIYPCDVFTAQIANYRKYLVNKND